MQIDVGIISKTGRYRDINADIARNWNEDKFDTQGGRLFIVADGTGRADYGKVAAQIATTTIPKLYYKQMRAKPFTPPKNALLNALHAANQRIYNKSHQLVSTGEMGVAVIVGVLHDLHMTLAWAGNCRAYFVPQEMVEAQQVTRDHIVSREMTAEADTGKLLLPILGAAENVRVGVRTVDMQIGDAMVLCSDGVHQVMKPVDISRIVKGRMSIRMAAHDLINTAQERGSDDNATALVIRLRDESAPPPEDDDAWAISHAEVTRLIENLNLTVDPRPEDEQDVTETKEIEVIPEPTQDTTYFEGNSLESIYHDTVNSTEFNDIPDDPVEQISREQEAEFQAWFDSLSRELQEQDEPSTLEEITAPPPMPDDSEEIMLGSGSSNDDDDNEAPAPARIATEETFDDIDISAAPIAEPDFLIDEVALSGDVSALTVPLDEAEDDDILLSGDMDALTVPLDEAGDDDTAPPNQPDTLDNNIDDLIDTLSQHPDQPKTPLARIRALKKSDLLVVGGALTVLIVAAGILWAAFAVFGGNDLRPPQDTAGKASPSLADDKETPSPPALPTLATFPNTAQPTEPPTLPPETFSGVPNGWVEGTVLYVTTPTGARRDIFSDPVNPTQYQPGDAVTITLARQRVGYREWYEYNGERWWFVDSIGWLAENELSENPR